MHTTCGPTLIDRENRVEGSGSFGLPMSDARGSPPTLYEWAGGRDAFRRLIDAFYDRVEADELLSALFPGGVGEEHRSNVTAWWCEVFGGPPTYTEELGGYERMLGRHRGLRITGESFFLYPRYSSQNWLY